MNENAITMNTESMGLEMTQNTENNSDYAEMLSDLYTSRFEISAEEREKYERILNMDIEAEYAAANEIKDKAIQLHHAGTADDAPIIAAEQNEQFESLLALDVEARRSAIEEIRGYVIQILTLDNERNELKAIVPKSERQRKQITAKICRINSEIGNLKGSIEGAEHFAANCAKDTYRLESGETMLQAEQAMLEEFGTHSSGKRETITETITGLAFFAIPAFVVFKVITMFLH